MARAQCPRCGSYNTDTCGYPFGGCLLVVVGGGAFIGGIGSLFEKGVPEGELGVTLGSFALAAVGAVIGVHLVRRYWNTIRCKNCLEIFNDPR